MTPEQPSLDDVVEINDYKFLVKHISKLTHTEDGHNKFYNIYVLEQTVKSASTRVEDLEKPWVVRVEWAAIGNPPQVQHNGFIDETNARKYATQRLKDKTKKGYKLIDGANMPTKPVEAKPAKKKFVEFEGEWDA